MRLLSIILFITFLFQYPAKAELSENDTLSYNQYDSIIANVYHSLGSKKLSFNAFSNAYLGYAKILEKGMVQKKNLLTVIDFDKSSKERRFFVIDIEKETILYESLVAHGKNSGWDIATSFSNKINSYKSSLGFYLTGETYFGKHGLSLSLDGLEKDINNNARKRHIVIHSADYVSDSFIKKVGRLGRSFGCPSLPSENYQNIVNLIKNKSLIFIYSNQKDYFFKSEYL